MSKRKTRERQLAKLAARRAAERRRRRRQRILAGSVGGAVFVAGAVVLVFALTGHEKRPAASGTPTPTPSATASPTPSYSPGTGKVTGYVTAQPAPKQVACGAKAPADARARKPQFTGAPPISIDPAKRYVAVMKTSCGTIEILLDAVRAPITVNSFVFLARHRYFDGQHIHRLDTSIDVVQGGDPMGTGTGGPGYSIPDELKGHETYPPGTLAMANAGPNTGGSQFFLITGPNGHKLDANPNYTVFGRVISGLGVAKRIQALPIQNPAAGLSGQQPKVAVYLESVTIRVTGPPPSPKPKPKPKRSKGPSPKPSKTPRHRRTPSPTPS